MAKPLTFYDLPLKARKLIYHYMGFTGCTVDLNYVNLDVYPQRAYPDALNVENVCCSHDMDVITRCEDYYTLEEFWEGDWDQDAAGPFRYLACLDDTCHAAEIADWLDGCYGPRNEAPEPYKFIFEKNHFRICRSSPRGFAPFLRIPKENLCDLGFLTVRLDGEPVQRIEFGEEWARLEQLVPLKHDSRYGKKALKEWETIVQMLADCIRPFHLTLYLIVSVPDAKTAKMVLKPLDRLPTLKNCGILLNRKPIPEFISLAQKTVQRITAPVTSCRGLHFRYLDLPIEIRWKILGYSDLVYHGALEWKPPLSSLGRVRQDAITIFFQRNQFLVSPSGTVPARLVSSFPEFLRHHGLTIPMQRVELSHFLSALTPNALQHISHLEWLVPRFSHYTRAPKSAYLDYLDTIELMAHAMNLPRLTLILNLRISYRTDVDDHGFRWPIRQPGDGAVYDRLLRPLGRLKGLKNFFVYLKRVSKKIDWTMSERQRFKFDNDEVRYEKLVMGEDYNSWERGKEWAERFEKKIGSGYIGPLDAYGDYEWEW
ncbi:hypothetical protein N0V90_006338 [Kalmusia sp. IMI 367209]|nr:hypothetical protein N0V90_006338 [Kalmusia sp. IMI 367209]